MCAEEEKIHIKNNFIAMIQLFRTACNDYSSDTAASGNNFDQKKWHSSKELCRWSDRKRLNNKWFWENLLTAHIIFIFLLFLWRLLSLPIQWSDFQFPVYFSLTVFFFVFFAVLLFRYFFCLDGRNDKLSGHLYTFFICLFHWFFWATFFDWFTIASLRHHRIDWHTRTERESE